MLKIKGIYSDTLQKEESNVNNYTIIDDNNNIIVKINTRTKLGSYGDRKKLTLRLQNALTKQKENIVITKDPLKKPGTAGFITIKIPLELLVTTSAIISGKKEDREILNSTTMSGAREVTADAKSSIKMDNQDPNLTAHEDLATALKKTIKDFYKEKQQSRCFGR